MLLLEFSETLDNLAYNFKLKPLTELYSKQYVNEVVVGTRYSKTYDNAHWNDLTQPYEDNHECKYQTSQRER